MAVLFSQLNTIELLEGSSDVLLKELGIKGGQIVKLRIAIQKYKNQVNYNLNQLNQGHIIKCS
jgi:hypothetical protein